MFFPDKGESARPAKRVCAGCEVRAECLQEALDRGERFGVWGGLSERERRALAVRLAGQPARVRSCPVHGGELSGGPVLYHCPAGRLGHGVTAADLAEARGREGCGMTAAPDRTAARRRGRCTRSVS